MMALSFAIGVRWFILELPEKKTLSHFPAIL